MILPPTSASIVLLGAVLLAGVGVATAEDYGAGGRITTAADRCSSYGYGYAEIGHGNCARTHVRVAGTRGADGWTNDAGTSSAALRFDELGTLPSAGSTAHLRVRSGLDTYSPFR